MLLHCVLITQSLVPQRHHIFDPLYALQPLPGNDIVAATNSFSECVDPLVNTEW